MEEALEVSKESIEFAQYVTAVRTDENSAAFRERLDDLSVAVKEGFKLLKEDTEQSPRIDAIWANINHSLSQMSEITMVCPIPNADFDEKMAAELGTCREQSTYDNAEGKLTTALKLLEEKPAEI